MMDRISIFQMVVGMAYAEEIGRELHEQKEPFEQFDVLTPKEPGWAWQMTKRLLSVPRNFLSSQHVEESSNVTETDLQIAVK